MKYFLVKQKDPGIFNELITNKLAEGWELYGSPSIDGVMTIQALVKKPNRLGSDRGLVPDNSSGKKSPKKPFPKKGG